jgi:hypothetical protein
MTHITAHQYDGYNGTVMTDSVSFGSGTKLIGQPLPRARASLGHGYRRGKKLTFAAFIRFGLEPLSIPNGCQNDDRLALLPSR